MAKHGKHGKHGKKAPPKRGGLMTGMRGGMKRAAGQGGPGGPRSRWGRVLDVALWLAVIAMALYWVLQR